MAVCIGTIGVNQAGKVFPVRCKLWSCPICGPLNAREHAARVWNGAKAWTTAGIMPYFVTITQPGTLYGRYAWTVLFDQWDKLRRKWAEWCEKRAVPFDYAAFVEAQSRGVPHLHIVAAFAPNTEEMKKMARASGFGHQCDAQMIKSIGLTGWYVAKYVGKGEGKYELPKGFRRVRYSEDFPQLADRVTDGLVCVKEFTETIGQWAARAKWELGVSEYQTYERAIYWQDMAGEDDTPFAEINAMINRD